MNDTTEYPPQSILGDPGQHPVGNGRDGVNQVLVAFATLSVVFAVVFATVMAVFFRRRRTNRKIYIPVTPTFNNAAQKPREGHGRSIGAVSSRGRLADIFESLVTKEIDEEEDDASEARTASHGEGINLSSALDRMSPGSPSVRVPSRGGDSKHSRSLPSLKHLSAHEEALSYLALGPARGSTEGPPGTKTRTTAGILGSSGDGNGFVRSRSFNERIAFGLNISRHSLGNRNRIDVTALNRCMTSTGDRDARPKAKGKENVKSRKQKNVRGSFIKSMRISNLVEFIPNSFNIKKRLSNSIGRQGRSAESSKTTTARASPVRQTIERSQSISANADLNLAFGTGTPESTVHRPIQRHHLQSTKERNNSEHLLESPTRPSFPEELGSDQKGGGIQRSRSCILLVIPPNACKQTTKMGNAISFNQLEEYRKKFSG